MDSTDAPRNERSKPTSWQRGFRVAAIGILVIGSSACTYHGAVRTNLYSPTDSQAPIVEKKLGLRLAVLKNKTLQNRPVEARNAHSAEINYYDALTNAVETSLGRRFAAVRLIDDPTNAG